MALQLLDDTIEIGIAGPEFLREPVTAAGSDSFTVGKHVELAGFARCEDRVDAETLLDEGRETRDLGGVVVSGGAMNNFDFHGTSAACGNFDN